MLILKEEWESHGKHLKAEFLAGTAEVGHFWFRAVSAAAKSDGVLEPYVLFPVAQKLGLDAERLAKFTRALIDCWVEEGKAGLFHDAESLEQCRSCKEMLRSQGHRPSSEAIVVHDFLEHNPSKRNKTPIGRKREKRKNDLNRASKDLRVDVYERDQGLCRYCGIRPNPDIPDMPNSLEMDHVDPACFEPNYGNFLENLVTSCKRCNRRKGERTPDEAGMPLLAIGTTARDIADGYAQPVTTPAEGRRPGSAEGVRAGSGQARAGVAPGSRRDRAGSPARGAKGGASRPRGDPKAAERGPP